MPERIVPCKRPRVELVEQVTNPGTVVAVCHVTGCAWTYPANPRDYVAVKSDAEGRAIAHRFERRHAVPVTRIVRDPEWDVHCVPCRGHLRTFGTKREAETWLHEHLVAERGLVAS